MGVLIHIPNHGTSELSPDLHEEGVLSRRSRVRAHVYLVCSVAGEGCRESGIVVSQRLLYVSFGKRHSTQP